MFEDPEIKRVKDLVARTLYIHGMDSVTGGPCHVAMAGQCPHYDFGECDGYEGNCFASRVRNREILNETLDPAVELV